MRDFMTGAYIGPYTEFDALSNFTDEFKRTESIAKAFRRTAASANKEQKRLIKARVWPFDRRTKRRNGQEVGSPRNIVDTRNLLKSHQAVRFS